MCIFRAICHNLFVHSLHPYHLPPVEWGGWTISFVRLLPTLTSLHLLMRAPQLWNSLPCQNEAAWIKAHLNIQALRSQKHGRGNYLEAIRLSKACVQVPKFVFALCQAQRWAIFFRFAEIKINSTAKAENSPNADACKQTHSFRALQQQLKNQLYSNQKSKINSCLESTPGISLFFLCILRMCRTKSTPREELQAWTQQVSTIRTHTVAESHLGRSSFKSSLFCLLLRL